MLGLMMIGWLGGWFSDPMRVFLVDGVSVGWFTSGLIGSVVDWLMIGELVHIFFRRLRT